MADTTAIATAITPSSSGSPTSSSTTRVLGSAVLVGIAAVVGLAFFVVEPDIRIDANSGEEIGQYDAVRLLFVHLPAAIVAYLAFTVTTIGSAVVLWKRSVWWDVVAGASAEVGALCAALTLITGSIWGRPIWNTWWEWGDVRILTTLVLFMLALGYLAVRRLEGSATERARRSAIVGLLLFVNVIIVNRSVEWWASQTLHQKSTIADAAIEGNTLFTMFLSIVVATAAYVWVMIHRFRLAWLERMADRFGTDELIAARRAEADDVEAIASAVGATGGGASAVGATGGGASAVGATGGGASAVGATGGGASAVGATGGGAVGASSNLSEENQS